MARESQPAEPQDTLQVRKQAFRHVSCRGMIALKRLRLWRSAPGQRRELPRRYCAGFCGRTSIGQHCAFEQATTTVARFCPNREVSPPSLTSLPVVVRILFAGQMYRYGLVEREVIQTEGPISRFDLSDPGGCG